MMKIGDVLAMKNGETKARYWLSPVPVFDDFGSKIEDVMYDGKTRMGPWALMAPASWIAYGVGRTGTGYGQKYKKVPGGKWLKVEG
jgi:hypothetical protein